MAAAIVNVGASVIELDGTNDTYTLEEGKVEYVENIIMTSVNAGLYTILIDGVSLSITTTVERLVEIIPWNRSVHSCVLAAEATAGKVFLLLKKG